MPSSCRDTPFNWYPGSGGARFSDTKILNFLIAEELTTIRDIGNSK